MSLSLLNANRAIFNAMWTQLRDMAQPAEVAAVLAPLAADGLTADAFTALLADAEVKAGLIKNTGEAVARGVFGAPTCFVGPAMFFGQDRLDFVREALVSA